MPNSRYALDHDACGVGFVTRLGAGPSREIVQRALTALHRLAHRGGVDADGRSGDGAGLLMAMPERFLRARARESGIRLPRRFGAGMLVMARVSPAAAINPTPIPIALRRNPWPTTSPKISDGPAPIAIRKPISAVLWRTNVARTP